MKVILEFDGDQEKKEYQNALNGSNYKKIIDDIIQMAHSKKTYLNQQSINVDELIIFVNDKIKSLIK